MDDAEKFKELVLSLESLDDRLTVDFERPAFPVFICLAQSRAGSTLLQQLLASTLDIGYVSNFLAKFWCAPYIGSLLEAQLDRQSFVSNFDSRFGNTIGSFEPHEWGWFWQKWLRLENDEDYVDPDGVVDWDGLAAKLAAIESVKGVPMLFDNVYAGANLDHLYKNLPNICVVHLRRELFYVCSSIINARLIRDDDIESHYGNRPRRMGEIENLSDPIERVVAQVRATEDEFVEILSQIASERVLTITYEDIIASPDWVSDQFTEFTVQNGVDIERREMHFNYHLKNRNDPGLVNPDYAERLKKHFKDYFPGEPV